METMLEERNAKHESSAGLRKFSREADLASDEASHAIELVCEV